MPELLIKKYQKLYFSIGNISMASALFIIFFLSFIKGFGLNDKLPNEYVIVLMILAVIVSLSFSAYASIEFDGDEK
jgi:hypothetical protein